MLWARLMNMGRMLIILGVLLIVAGVAVVALEHMSAPGTAQGGAARSMQSWLSRLPFGRLPGDVRYRGRHVAVFAPLGTSLLLSVLITLVLLVLARLRR